MDSAKSEIRDGMQIDWDVPIEMDDGIMLRADIYRPAGQGKFPIILSYGPYAKGLSFQEGYKGNWARLTKAAPEVLQNSSNKYQNWELIDPEKWVPDGFVLVRVDSRGAGRSPGTLDVWSAREAQDLYACVEWAGTQSWSNGKVGINGISYYAMNQWQVGALKPPHLAALCIWEGSSDFYRELYRHGGILSDFLNSWHPRQVASVQHGVGDSGAKSVVTGEPVAGPSTLSKEELVKNRADTPAEAKQHVLYDDYYAARTPDFAKIEAPLLSAGNWGGMGLHTRGNFEGYLRAGTKQKWLEVHGDTHFTHFYSNYGEALQKKFFGHFLKGDATGWDKQPRVSLNIRHPGEKFVIRAENEWPLKRTQWTKYFMHPDGGFGPDIPKAEAKLSYDTASDGLIFGTPPLDKAARNHRPGRRQAVGVIRNHRCRSVFGAAAVRSARQRSYLHRRQRSARADRPRLAARLASQARSEKVATPPALAQPRRDPAAQTGRAGRTRYRDMANLHRRAGRLPAGAQRARQGLRSRRQRRSASPCALPDEGCRPVPAYRQRRPPGCDLQRPQHAAFCSGAAALPLVAGHTRGLSFPKR